jgi:hypothetical protein
MSKRNILETIDYCRDGGDPNNKKYPHRRESRQSFMKVYNDFDDWRSHNRYVTSPVVKPRAPASSPVNISTKSFSIRHSLDNNRPNDRINVPSTITTENESSEEYKNSSMNWDTRFTSPMEGIDSSTRTLVQRMEEDEDEADYDCFIPVPHLKAVRYLFDTIFQLNKSQNSTYFP